MGADIHCFVEARIGDKWVMVKSNPEKAEDRNYTRFGALAGVRYDGPEPRGIPSDVSEGAKWHIDSMGPDGHSHSWLPIQEAATTFWATDRDEHKGKLVWAAGHYFDLCDHELAGTDFRLIFFFDN